MKECKFTVSCKNKTMENDRFWAACGIDSLYPLVFTQQGEWLMSRMKTKGTCRYMRNHHTLSSLVKDGFADAGGNVYSEDENGNPIYCFDKINAVFHRYLDYSIKPIVELDYLPDALSYNIETGGKEQGRYNNRFYPNDWNKWSALLRAFVKNLLDEFGSDEVENWYFEVWNEPDGWSVGNWPMFYRLYDVFADCVMSVDSRLKIGGPGAFKPDFMRGFLEHIATGTNYVTGKKGSRIDFISYHIYGMSGGWLDEYPLIMPTVQRFTQQIMWLQRMIEEYPCLKNKPIHINEWGVISNYERGVNDYKALELRDSEFSACFFAKLVDCIQKLRTNFNVNIELLLYWGFCLEDTKGLVFNGNRGLSCAPNIPKPIQTAHEMLSMLGNDFVEVSGNSGGRVGCLAARDETGVQLIIYNFSEYDEQAELPDSGCDISIDGIADGEYIILTVVLDKNRHNTFRKWQEFGSRKEIDTDIAAEIREASELSFDSKENVEVKDGRLNIKISLSPQSVSLITVKRKV